MTSDDNWVLIAMATGLLIVGSWVIADGIGLFRSIEGSFVPFSLLLRIGIVAVGGYLFYLCVSVITDMG